MRCNACARVTRVTYGRFALCKRCNEQLARELETWDAHLSESLETYVRFDAYYAAKCFPPNLPPTSQMPNNGKTPLS
jgi:hypothetical protein